MRSARIVVVAMILVAALGALSAGAETPAQEKGGTAADEAAGRGLALLTRDDFQGAASAFEQADRLGGCDEICLIALARAYLGAGRFDQAEATARRAIAAESPGEESDAYITLGYILMEGHAGSRLAEAEAAFRKAIEISPVWSGAARANLAEALHRLGRDEEAVAEARKVLASEPTGRAAVPARVLVCRFRKAPPPAVAEPVRVGDGITRPEIVYRVSPQYTEKARLAKLQGTVILQAVIDEEGCVVDDKILQGLGSGMDVQADRAIRQWVFQPAMGEGKPVRVYYTLTVNFQVDSGRH